MQQYFHNQPLEPGDRVYLQVEDTHHIRQVMRQQVGDQIRLVDSQGQTYLAELTSLEGPQLQVEISKPVIESQELPVHITLACGLIKADKQDWLVQKATEMGMAAFIPLVLQRNVVKWTGAKLAKKTSRLAKIAKEAAEQAHRQRIPQVHSLMGLEDLPLGDFDQLWLADEERAKSGEHTSLVQALARTQPGQRIVVVFGPEGGFDPEEVAWLIQAGFQSLSLGPRILRAETAPLYLLAASSFTLEMLRKEDKE